MVDYERYVVLGYIENLLEAYGHHSGVINEIGSYLDNHPNLIIEHSALLSGAYEESGISCTKTSTPRSMLNDFKTLTIDIIKNCRENLTESELSAIELNLRMLSEHLNLDDTERDFFALVVRHRYHNEFYRILNHITGDHLSLLEVSAGCIKADLQVLTECLKPNCKLFLSGVFSIGTKIGPDIDDHFEIAQSVSTVIQKGCRNISDLLISILGETVKPLYQWDDFDYLGEVRDRLALLLKNMRKENAKGINILLWGKPGTGKTEFIKTLAAQLDMNLYSVCEADEDGGEPTRTERLRSYRLTQNLLRYQKDSLILFDEMDDVFQNQLIQSLMGGRNSGSKVFMNRLLETNPVPTIWLINDPSMLEESFLRRMTFIAEIKTPPVAQREKVWIRVLDKNHIKVPREIISRMSHLDLSPALVDCAAKYTHHVEGDVNDFMFATENILHVINGTKQLSPKMNDQFDPTLTNADVNLSDLTGSLVRSTKSNFSLCLYGPSGTGKSAYLRYLADQIGMPVMMKRASDLLNKYVGGSEKNIAKAFQEAIDKEAFLVFDEVDSLLSNRKTASHSWEVTQVNEMLTWMENHPLPFACTTNLMERIDQASLRRFTFKFCFSYLLPHQIESAFQHFFHIEPTNEHLKTLKHLTPGDFAVVRKKAEVLGMLNQETDLIHLLKAEIVAKHETSGNVIGFKSIAIN